jgi:hypothetical protein
MRFMWTGKCHLGQHWLIELDERAVSFLQRNQFFAQHADDIVAE